MPIRPFRYPWHEYFPDVLIHSLDMSAVKKHHAYADAKRGDVDASDILVNDTLSNDVILQLVELGEDLEPILISVHAEEAVGVNAIPEVMADQLSFILDWDVERAVVQANVVNHTGANGFSRLARQAVFEGEIVPERHYVIVDDFIGQGGTIANLRGHIMQQGGIVLGATVLTGRDYSAILTLQTERLNELQDKHGQIEDWWRERFGFGFDALTASEARYLINTPLSERICTQIEGADASA